LSSAQATPFITVPADRAITIGIAGENSNSAADAIATFPANFNTGGTYVVMAAGVVGATGATAFDLFVKEGAREISSGPANVDVQLFHGAPDAPEVDVRLPGGAILFDNVEFGEYADYQSIPATNYQSVSDTFQRQQQHSGCLHSALVADPGSGSNRICFRLFCRWYSYLRGMGCAEFRHYPSAHTGCRIGE
jgi:hypothetical protein